MGELHRGLGLASLTFYGVGLILGAGIYTIIGEAAGVAGEALWLSFLLGSLAALLTGLSYAELATMFPRAGAEYVYLREAWPRMSWLPGTMGWVLAMATVAVVATVALAFAGYASLFVAFAFVNAAVVRLRVTRPEEERPFRVPLDLGRVPVLAALGLLVVVVLLTQFEVRAYGIAAAALAIAFGVQAVPWGPTADGGQRERE